MKKYCYIVGAALLLFALGSTQSAEATEVFGDESYQEALDAGYTAEQIQKIQEMPDFSLETIEEQPAARSAVTFAAASQKTQIVNEARRHLGKPYAWGGKGPNVFDCSGLTRYVYLQVTGKNIGDYTVPQEKSGEQISVAQAEPGDLYFWGAKGNTYHVAIAIGNNQYIHAPNVNEVVKINSTTYFKPDFAVRVIKNSAPAIPNLVSYRTHVQDFGWGGYVAAGQPSGSTGQKKRLEGIQIKLDSSVNGGIQYKTHIQDIGWQGWKANNALSGTTGQKKRLEAIQIQLTGTAATQYDVQYRVHSQDYGWQAWTKNGQSSGTQGLSKRLEAIEIRVVPKNTALPTGGKAAFIKK
ncbi:NlpC/P60 family protein [Enterococcus sp. AZ192]|uniref:NlpC/P60 family protein n=1 Tax=unclassified Enterococcus TaxID=2608891 RepID=UPI003D277332